MEVYTTEEEQIAAIKKWWKENWLSLLGGVLIGLGILFGGKYWWDHRNYHAEMGSIEYEAMVQAVTQDKTEEASNHALALLKDYADTPYAALAALTMAKIKVDSNDLVAAKSHLRWAMDNAVLPEVKTEAQIRYARVLLAEERYDDALQQLSNVTLSEYDVPVQELKGDIYVAQNDKDKARIAYERALVQLSQSQSSASPRLKNYLQIKLDDLGGVAEPPVAEPAAGEQPAASEPAGESS
ncbi:MAG: tetratricopeptide repeat protein [Gammaproteobacteria bacterium]